MCNYEGCERANYKMEDGREFGYCIFHLPKESVYPDGVKILKSGIHSDGKTKKEFRYKGTEEQIREDFKKELKKYLSKIDEKIKNGNKEAFYDFRGFYFHFDEVAFKGREFRAKTDFENAIFFGSANFEETKFLDGVNFSGTKFKSNANFSGAKIRGISEFDYTLFEKEAAFLMAEFERSNFHNSVFKGYAWFQNAEFERKTVFSSCEFEVSADFSGSKFHNELRFGKTDFKGAVDFSGCFFGGYDPLKEEFGEQSNEESYPTAFENVKFEDKGRGANFNGAVFNAETRFIDSIFKGTSNFIGTKFRDNILFTNSKSANETVFEGDVSFDLAEFSTSAKFFTPFVGIASFRGCQFLGDTYFLGPFQKEVHFEPFFRKNFSYNGYLTEYATGDIRPTLFQGPASFSKVEFRNIANFEGVKIVNGATFKKSKFFNKANFGFFFIRMPPANTYTEKTEVRGNIDFSDVEFKGDADFTGVRFEDKASFENTTFSGTIQFKSINLEGIDIDSIFTGKATFKNSTFESKAIFEWVKFRDEVNFYKAKFRDAVSFEGTGFGAERTEGRKKSSRDIIFEFSVFKGDATFKNARFYAEIKKKHIGEIYTKTDSINFKNVEFFRYADFNHSEINGIMLMTDSTFQGNTSFKGIKTTKECRIYLNRSSVAGRLIFEGESNNIFIILESIKTTPRAEIEFADYKMDRVIFSRYMDLTKVRLINTKWPTIRGRTVIVDKDILKRTSGLKMYKCPQCSSLIIKRDDEVDICPVCSFQRERGVENMELLEIDEESEHYYDFLVSLYELLRKSYESRNRHVEAGDFYIREMEARTKWLKYREHEGIIERAKDLGYRFLIWVYNLFSKYGESTARPIACIILTTFSFGIIFSWYSGLPVLNGVVDSLFTLYQMPPESLKNNAWASAERILGFIFNSLLILSLNRKFKRRD